MNAICAEIKHRFPEIVPSVREGDDELVFVMTSHLIDWLLLSAKCGLSEAAISRVVGFHNWCESQSRSEALDKDALTVFVVGVLEKLFEEDELQPMIPHLCSEADLYNNEKYLVTSVGAENWKQALKQFKKESR